ncbi:MAG: hypothetical protein JWO38_4898 [Gemmataceae bacterium]|nr:hypothetical protein [Gemmataceae bacterium]
MKRETCDWCNNRAMYIVDCPVLNRRTGRREYTRQAPACEAHVVLTSDPVAGRGPRPTSRQPVARAAGRQKGRRS